MLVYLAVLPLLLGPALAVPTGDHWEAWGAYGDCSRTCGSGVAMRTRRCITQRTDGGHNCVGPDKSFSSCNVQDCSEGSKDFREEQCSQFDGSDFQGKRYKWLPYYGAENPCELNCMPRGENFFYRHRSAVADGTPCHPGRRDICVDGVCKRLGCDNQLDSLQQEDACLQCGGSGRSCRRVHNTFTTNGLPNGYNQMLIIPVGATSIRIAETVPTRNYLAIKNLRGEYYLNGHWVIEFSRSTPVAGTVLFYQRGAEGGNTPETIVGRGPTTEPLVIEMISQELNQGVDFEYYLPNGRSREGYFWSYGSWTPCSFQSRLVFCAIDNEAYPDYLCASLPRPSSNRTCNAQACPQTRRVAFLYGPLMWSQAQRPRTLVYRASPSLLHSTLTEVEVEVEEGGGLTLQGSTAVWPTSASTADGSDWSMATPPPRLRSATLWSPWASRPVDGGYASEPGVEAGPWAGCRKRMWLRARCAWVAALTPCLGATAGTDPSEVEVAEEEEPLPDPPREAGTEAGPGAGWAGTGTGTETTGTDGHALWHSLRVPAGWTAAVGSTAAVAGGVAGARGQPRPRRPPAAMRPSGQQPYWDWLQWMAGAEPWWWGSCTALVVRLTSSAGERRMGEFRTQQDHRL
ncbi:hypothetical protein CRUP_004611 [Coryphaenoides rupestris]|nr:hypothetical protein CRUP_004611 [Coryphaenoides rupestris]